MEAMSAPSRLALEFSSGFPTGRPTGSGASCSGARRPSHVFRAEPREKSQFVEPSRDRNIEAVISEPCGSVGRAAKKYLWSAKPVGVCVPQPATGRQSGDTTIRIEFAGTSLSSRVNGRAARLNFTLLRTPSQPTAPLKAEDFTMCPSCTTSIQDSEDNVIL